MASSSWMAAQISSSKPSTFMLLSNMSLPLPCRCGLLQTASGGIRLCQRDEIRRICRPAMEGFGYGPSGEGHDAADSKAAAKAPGSDGSRQHTGDSGGAHPHGYKVCVTKRGERAQNKQA